MGYIIIGILALLGLSFLRILYDHYLLERSQEKLKFAKDQLAEAAANFDIKMAENQSLGLELGKLKNQYALLHSYAGEQNLEIANLQGETADALCDLSEALDKIAKLKNDKKNPIKPTVKKPAKKVSKKSK